MKILILGASGFIGKALFHALVSKHDVYTASRTNVDGYGQWSHLDFSEEQNWKELLKDIDLVINAIGIIEGGFDQIQTKGPIALFEHCKQENTRVINISAVGAEKDQPPTQFLQSKKATDDFLLQYEHAKVVYPGIVIGRNGKSSQFFAAIAQLPVIPLVKDESPYVHITQLTELISQIVDDFDSFEKQVFATSEKEELKDILNAMKGRKAIYLPVPTVLFKILFGIFPRASLGIFNRDTLKMQSVISASDYEPRFEKASSKIDPKNLIASDVFVRTLALSALVFIWVWSGISSLTSWKISKVLMYNIGASDQLADVLIYLGSGVDIFLGIILLFKKHRKKVLIFQVVFILTYTLILTIFAPYFWMHPLGVVSKNIPLLALTAYLIYKESKGAKS